MQLRPEDRVLLKELSTFAFESFQGLIPEGALELLPVCLNWTKEEGLGRLKRAGIVHAWKQIGTVEGNMRAYSITVESKYL